MFSLTKGQKKVSGAFGAGDGNSRGGGNNKGGYGSAVAEKKGEKKVPQKKKK